MQHHPKVVRHSDVRNADVASYGAPAAVLQTAGRRDGQVDMIPTPFCGKESIRTLSRGGIIPSALGRGAVPC